MVEEEDRLSSDFSFDSSYNEEYNRVVPVESTPQSGFRQEIVGRNEFHQQFETTLDKYETINNVAESNYPKTMNQHNLNQHQHEQQQPGHVSEELQHASETKPSALSNRRVSIIDETNRTRDKISKKRRKKTTRLRKPLQNDDLLKNYFEMDTVSSNQVTTFKIIQSDSTKDTSHALSHHDDQSPHEQQQTCNESFITKETFQVSNTKDSKLSESSEESNNRTSISSLTESSHNTSSYYHNNPITLQELMNSETMHNFTLDSNNRNSFTESVLYHSISSIPPPTPSLHENPNPEPFTSQYPIAHHLTNRNDTNFQEIPQNDSYQPSSQLHETENNINNNFDFSQFNENLDLLQFLLQLTDTSGQDSTISKENDQK